MSASKTNSRVIAPAANQPTGKNIYIDKKRRIIYVSPLLHQAFLIPKSSYIKFNRYKSRFLLSLSVFLVLATTLPTWFHTPVWVCGIIALVLFAGLEYSYYKFLKTLPTMDKFDPQKACPTVIQEITPEMRNKCWVRIILYLLLGILLVINAYDQHYDVWMLIACWGVLAYCFYAALRLFLLLFKKN